MTLFNIRVRKETTRNVSRFVILTLLSIQMRFATNGIRRLGRTQLQARSDKLIKKTGTRDFNVV